MNNKTVTFMTVLMVSGMILIAPSPTFAATSQNPFSSFMQSLTQKLGIGQDKVQTAVDSIWTERQQEMQKLYEEKLSTAVKEGALTEAQKKLLLNKHAQLQKQFEADWQKKQAERTELDNWLKQNNIDPQYLFGGYGRIRGGMHKGFGRGMMWR